MSGIIDGNKLVFTLPFSECRNDCRLKVLNQRAAANTGSFYFKVNAKPMIAFIADNLDWKVDIIRTKSYITQIQNELEKYASFFVGDITSYIIDAKKYFDALQDDILKPMVLNTDNNALKFSDNNDAKQKKTIEQLKNILFSCKDTNTQPGISKLII